METEVMSRGYRAVVLQLPRHAHSPRCSRRRFLAQVAGAGAGGAVLALATFPPAPAAAVPASPLDPAKAGPALRTAVIALDEAHERLKEANAAVSADDATVTKWRELNPKTDRPPRAQELGATI